HDKAATAPSPTPHTKRLLLTAPPFAENSTPIERSRPSFRTAALDCLMPGTPAAFVARLVPTFIGRIRVKDPRERGTSPLCAARDRADPLGLATPRPSASERPRVPGDRISSGRLESGRRTDLG